MFNFGIDTTFTTIQFIASTVEGAAEFNFFFTIVTLSGMLAWGFGLLCSIISRS